MPMYLEHINSISELFQETVSIFLGNKYMWLKNVSKKKKKYEVKNYKQRWFLNAIRTPSHHISKVS